ncbi:sensor histidine kinase [Luteimonas sp. RIT-PG2_3]
MTQGLPRRIRVAFIRQALLAFVAVVVSVLLTAWLARNALVEEMLEAEASGFWAAQATDSSHRFSRTALLDGYFLPANASNQAVPAKLRALSEGLSRVDGGATTALVTSQPGGTLYLSLAMPRIDRVFWLAAFGLMGVGLVLVGLITVMTYRQSRGMVLPINRLAEDVAAWDPSRHDDSQPLPFPLASDGSKEVRSLSNALHGLAGRMSRFVQRERDFTRDASHELRTPLTVIRVATDMTLSDPAIPDHTRRSLQRIQQAGRDMESLIDAFLILARERGIAPQSEEFDLRDLVLDEIEKARPSLACKPVEIRFVETASPRLMAPPGVMAVMIGHLISNACVFTESGSVEVELLADRLVVRDTGIGMSADTLERLYDPFFRADEFNPLGKGMGMSIVRRLGNRFGWPVHHESTPGKGTTATIRFVPALAS